jgi:hypothetical protein
MPNDVFDVRDGEDAEVTAQLIGMVEGVEPQPHRGALAEHTMHASPLVPHRRRRQIDAGGRCNETEGVSSMRVSFASKSPHAVIVKSAVTAHDRRRIVVGIREMAHRARGHLGRRTGC